MIKHYSLRVYGRVQGINYRSSAHARAIKLGVTGFVRNEPDGSVFLEAEGDEVALKSYLTWCKRGPWFAKVERVEAEEGSVQQFVDFTIC
jgi:acylphosphatase